MHLIRFSTAGWQDWDVEQRPLIRSDMPVVVDADLRFEDGGHARAAAVVNQWLWELPVRGVHSPRSWEVYARALKAWLEFLAEADVAVFGSRAGLRAVLGSYAEYRLAGPLTARWSGSSWNLNMTVLTGFYEWAVDQGYAEAVPFSFAVARHLKDGLLVETRRNLAKVRTAKPHTTLKYLEPEFADLLVRALDGMLPDGTPDSSFRGRNPGRNSAMARLVLSSGLRKQEFTYLLVHEVPPLPMEPTPLPVPLPVGAAIAKGGKQRTTWVSYEALEAVHRYVRLERELAVAGSSWRPAPHSGPPLVVTNPDWHGGTIGGRRVAWASLAPDERLRLVDDSGGTLLLGVQTDGSPFLDWATVLRRAADGIRARFDPRFPHVKPHRLRHTMAMRTLETLVAGYYQQAARVVLDTGADAAMAFYLTKADPLMVLRDLLGHSTVTTTQVYVSKLDMTRVFADAYADVGRQTGLAKAVATEVKGEFDDDVLARI